MTRVLLKKYVHDAKWLLLACAAATFAFCWVRVWIVSRLDTGRFKAILDLLPGDWERFTSVDFEWLITYAGRISLAYDEFIVIVCMAMFAIARGSDCVSGEVGRGTMEMMLAQPLSRLKVLVTHSSVTVVGVALLALAAWGGTGAGIYATVVKEEVVATWQLPIPLPWIGSEIPIPFAEPQTIQVRMSEKVDLALFWPATVSLFALGFMIAGFTTLMSSWDRYRWRTIGIVVSVFLVQAIVKIVGMGADEVQWLLYLSAFTPYEPEAFVRIADTTPELTWQLFLRDEQGGVTGFGPLWHHLTMFSIGLVSYLAAAAIFWRRDLPAPL